MAVVKSLRAPFVALLSGFLGFASPVSAQPPATAIGRFGWSNVDGLLTLTITPNGFSVPAGCPPLHVQFSNGQTKAKVLKVDSTEKILAVNGAAGAPVRLRYTLLYPGFSGTFGKRMSLRISANGNKLPQVFPETYSQESLLIMARQESCIPLLLIFENGIVPAISEWKEDGAAISVRLESPKPIGEVRFVTPLGLRPLPAGANNAEMEQLHSACRRWVRSGIPELQSSAARVTANGAEVEFTERFKTALGEPIAPTPPILPFAIKNGYQAKILTPYVSTMCRTKWGDFAYVRGSTLTYRLPLPPMDERGYVRTLSEGSGDLEGLLNELAGSIGNVKGNAAGGQGFRGLAGLQMAWAHLNHDNRIRLNDAWHARLDEMFRMPSATLPSPWIETIEPFSKTSFLTQNAEAAKHGLSEGVGGSSRELYELCIYAQFSGDWAAIKSHWSTIQRISRLTDLTQDWAAFAPMDAIELRPDVNGAALSAAFCGAVACLKMSRVIGDTIAMGRYAAAAARFGLAVTCRLYYSDWARRTGRDNPKSLVTGYQEMDGFTSTGLGDEDPWRATTVIASDCVCPELIFTLARFAVKPLSTYEHEYANAFPDWYRGGTVYPFKCAHNGNSVGVVFPHILARAILGETEEKLREYIHESEFNRDGAWLGPNVIAELLSLQSPIVLTDWAPAGYIGGSVSEDASRIELQFRLYDQAKWTLKADWRPNRQPKRILVNGQPTPFTVQQHHLRLELNAAGKIRVEIQMDKGGE